MQMQIIVDRFLRDNKSHRYNLTSHDRLLMFILASYMGNKNTCWPNYENLMIDCAMSKPTVIKSVKKLEKLGLLIVDQKREKGSYKKSNRYSFSSKLDLLENDSQVNIRTFSSKDDPHSQVNDVYSNNISNNINNNINAFVENENEKTVSPILEEYCKDHGLPY